MRIVMEARFPELSEDDLSYFLKKKMQANSPNKIENTMK
jgi:hypothetical protein